jgi:hypothetical protein
LDELIQQIQNDYTQQQDTKLDESLSIKFLDNIKFSPNINEEFIHSQLLIDCLIRMKSSLNDKNELISFCKQYYQNNKSQLMIIKEFENDYSSERSIWWYTRHSFLFRLLNKALQDKNIDLLYLFRFIIHDIGYQLGKNQCSSIIRVYRIQLMSKDEFQILKNSIGKFLSINSFLSTSMDNEKTRSLLQSADFSNDIEKVFFEIEADPRLRNIRPFSNIQAHSYVPKAREILFMVGSIFRIDKIERDNDKIWNVRLILCSINDKQLKSFFQHMKNELGTGKTSLLRFGHILRQMNKLTNSEKYYRRYLNQLPNNHPDIPNCYNALGIVAESKKNFVSSLKWYKKSLKIFQQTQELDNSNIADVYNNIANVYSKKNDYTNAIKSYQKELDIYKKILDENHPRIIKCLNNMGAVYDMKKNYSEAIDCYQKALEISKKTKDPDIAVTLRNIANAYELQGEFRQALDYYQKAQKAYRNSSSPNEVYITDIQTSIQRVSSKLK